VDLMTQVCTWDPFDTSLFAWIDFRALELSPVDSNWFSRVPEITDPQFVSINLMKYEPPDFVRNRQEYYYAMRGLVAGTFWIGGKSAILEFARICREELEWCLRHELCPTEEQVFGAVLCENHQKFRYYFGDYVDSLSSYECVRRNGHLAVRTLQRTYEVADYPVLCRCARALQAGRKAGLVLDPFAIYQLCYYQFVAWYWLGDREKSLEAARSLVKEAQDSAVAQEIRLRKEFILQNLAYLNNQELLDEIAQI
ncbi:MAG: hypothetical protein ACYCOU_15780, partial [Sulfobacillus sp.]